SRQHRRETRTDGSAPPAAAERQAHEGIDAQHQRERQESENEGRHLVNPRARCAERSALWKRLTLPDTRLPLLSSLKRKIVLSWPWKVSSAGDSRTLRTRPSLSCTETMARTAMGKRASTDRKRCALTVYSPGHMPRP